MIVGIEVGNMVSFNQKYAKQMYLNQYKRQMGKVEEISENNNKVQIKVKFSDKSLWVDEEQLVLVRR